MVWGKKKGVLAIVGDLEGMQPDVTIFSLQERRVAETLIQQSLFGTEIAATADRHCMN